MRFSVCSCQNLFFVLSRHSSFLWTRGANVQYSRLPHRYLNILFQDNDLKYSRVHVAVIELILCSWFHIWFLIQSVLCCSCLSLRQTFDLSRRSVLMFYGMSGDRWWVEGRKIWLLLIQGRAAGGGAYPSCHWERGGEQPGRFPSSSQVL